jgi:PAS domain S-box-containing protein
MDEIIKTLSKNIKRYRQDLGISQEELSERCQYSRTYLGKIERGEVNPSFETLIRIADVFGIPLSELLDDTTGELPDGKDKLYHEIFRHSSTPAGIIDDDGEIIEINDSFEDYFNIQDSLLIGRKLWSLPKWLNADITEDKIRKTIQKARDQEHLSETFPFKDSSQPLQLIVNRLTMNGDFYYFFEFFSVELFLENQGKDYELSEIRTK